MSLIHLARQGFITKSALPNVTRQRGTTTGTANLMLYGAGKDHSIGTNTTFTDSSTNNFTVTRNGDTIQATNNPFTGSVYFDGNGDYLSVANNTAFDFGTGNFTIECWFYLVGNSAQNGNGDRFAQIVGRYTVANNTGYEFNIAGNSTTTGTGFEFINTVAGTQNKISASATIAQQQWNHVAVVRNGTTTSIYLNGVSIGSGTLANQSITSTNNLWVGALNVTNYNHYINGYITNLRVVKGTAVYTSAFTPPTSPLTAITNTQLLLLTAQQAPFRDSSTNNFTVTANGNAAGSGLEPFPVNYAGSGYFDGTGDYLTVTNSAALQLTDATAFTIECWVYPTSLSGTEKFIIENYNQSSPFQGYGIRYSVSNSILEWWEGGASWVNTGITLTTNEWTHIAVTYEGSGTTRRFFKNGVLSGSAGTVSSGINYTAGACSIGAQEAGLFPWIGYISNLRVIKGTAQYTAAFTPPAAPLTAVTNTSLLLLTNNVGPFVDTSANGFPVLRNGDTVQTGFSPFTGQPSAGSAYFDGTGDYLSIANSTNLDLPADFTVEAWIYPTSTAKQCIIGKWQNPVAWILIINESSNTINFGVGNNGSFVSGNTFTGTPAINTWSHIAVTRSGSSLRCFLNGTQAGSTVTQTANCTATSDVNIGRTQSSNTDYFTGYISNLRVIKGTALYTSNFTPATAPLPAVPNTSLLLNTDNYTIANSTPTYLPVTVAGNTTISTAQYPTGMNRSIYFDGSGDTLSVPTNSMFEFGTGTFTVECFIYQTANSGVRGVLGTHSSYFAGGWGFYINNGSVTFQIFVNGTSSVDDAGNSNTVALNTWTHIAAVRDGSTLTVYVNGVAGTSVTSTKNGNNNAAFYVGAYEQLAQFPYYFMGYISNVRVIKGAALYTANFTPPAAPLPLSVTVPAFVTNNIYGVYQLA